MQILRSQLAALHAQAGPEALVNEDFLRSLKLVVGISELEPQELAIAAPRRNNVANRVAVEQCRAELFGVEAPETRIRTHELAQLLERKLGFPLSFQNLENCLPFFLGQEALELVIHFTLQ